MNSVFTDKRVCYIQGCHFPINNYQSVAINLQYSKKFLEIPKKLKNM